MKKIVFRIDLEKTAMISCAVAALLLLAEIIAVTVFRFYNATLILALVVLMNAAMTLCLSTALLQRFLQSTLPHRADDPDA